jgi:hypothetical protein
MEGEDPTGGSKKLACTITEVVVLGYMVRMQMLSKVFFNIISYSLSA